MQTLKRLIRRSKSSGETDPLLGKGQTQQQIDNYGCQSENNVSEESVSNASVGNAAIVEELESKNFDEIPLYKEFELYLKGEEEIEEEDIFHKIELEQEKDKNFINVSSYKFDNGICGSLLHIAAYYCNENAIKFLLKNSADVNVVGRYLVVGKRKGQDCCTPLYLAVGKRNLSCIELLVNMGARIVVDKGSEFCHPLLGAYRMLKLEGNKNTSTLLELFDFFIRNGHYCIGIPDVCIGSCNDPDKKPFLRLMKHKKCWESLLYLLCLKKIYDVQGFKGFLEYGYNPEDKKQEWKGEFLAWLKDSKNSEKVSEIVSKIFYIIGELPYAKRKSCKTAQELGLYEAPKLNLSEEERVSICIRELECSLKEQEPALTPSEICTTIAAFDPFRVDTIICQNVQMMYVHKLISASAYHKAEEIEEIRIRANVRIKGNVADFCCIAAIVGMKGKDYNNNDAFRIVKMLYDGLSEDYVKEKLCGYVASREYWDIFVLLLCVLRKESIENEYFVQVMSEVFSYKYCKGDGSYFEVGEEFCKKFLTEEQEDLRDIIGNYYQTEKELERGENKIFLAENGKWNIIIYDNKIEHLRFATDQEVKKYQQKRVEEFEYSLKSVPIPGLLYNCIIARLAATRNAEENFLYNN